MTACPVDAGARPLAPDYLPLATVRVLQLAPNDCRWPIGEPADVGFAFCSAHRLDRGAYCAAHRRLACEPRR